MIILAISSSRKVLHDDDAKLNVNLKLLLNRELKEGVVR